MDKTEEAASEVSPEIRTLDRENRQLKRQIKGFKGQIAVLNKRTGQTEVKPSPIELPEATSKPSEAPAKHFVHNSDRYCTDCGGPNPAFKDETECSGCKKSLGSIAGMKDLKACPDCGSSKFKAKRELTTEEKGLFNV